MNFYLKVCGLTREELFDYGLGKGRRKYGGETESGSGNGGRKSENESGSEN